MKCYPAGDLMITEELWAEKWFKRVATLLFYCLVSEDSQGTQPYKNGKWKGVPKCTHQTLGILWDCIYLRCTFLKNETEQNWPSLVIFPRDFFFFFEARMGESVEGKGVPENVIQKFGANWVNFAPPTWMALKEWTSHQDCLNPSCYATKPVITWAQCFTAFQCNCFGSTRGLQLCLELLLPFETFPL